MLHPDEKKEKPRSGSSVAEDDSFTTWLSRLWARNEPPERIEVWQLYGRTRPIRGEMIHHHDFKPNEKVDVERVNKIANEIMEAAQTDCDTSEKKSMFQVCVIDRNRKAAPLTRRVGPLFPKRAYLTSGDGSDEDLDDDEDVSLSGRSLSLSYIREGFDQVRWDKQRIDRTTGQLLMMQQGIIQQQQTFIDLLATRSMGMFDQLQQARDHEVDRKMRLEMDKFKLSLYRDGLRTARNLLPALFGPSEDAPAPTPEIEIAGDEPRRAGPPRLYGASPERALVDALLNDCEEAQIAIPLFGDWEGQDGKLVPNPQKPGIFTPAQFYVFLGVQNGRLPPASLDALMVGSGDPRAFTRDQISKAQELMPEGIQMGLLELVALRKRQTPAPTTT